MRDFAAFVSLSSWTSPLARVGKLSLLRAPEFAAYAAGSGHGERLEAKAWGL
jgi:hypothetical protein